MTMMNDPEALEKARALLNKTDHMLTSGEECKAIAVELKRAYASGMLAGGSQKYREVIGDRILEEADLLEANDETAK